MAKILRGYLFPAYEIKINVELFENVNFIFFLIGLIINPFWGGVIIFSAFFLGGS